MHRLLLLIVMAVISWGCSMVPATVVPESPTPMTPASIDTLSGEWILQQMNGESLTELTVSLEFTAAQATGVSFCNNYSTTVTADGDALTFDAAIVATKMLCPEGDTMQREQVYFETLGTITTYAEIDGRLELRDASGKPVLVYQR